MDRDKLLDTLDWLWEEKDRVRALTFIGAVLAEFDRLTEELDNAILLANQRAYEIGELEKEVGRLAVVQDLLIQDKNKLMVESGEMLKECDKVEEALERICKPAVNWREELRKTFYPHIALPPLEVQACWVIQKVCDYLDSQQKPTTTTGTSNVMECDHEEDLLGAGRYQAICGICGKSWAVKPLDTIEKPKDEEVLRGILEKVDCDRDLMKHILQHFQLKEGE